MNGGMQLRKNRLSLQGVFGGDGVVAKFPDAVIETPSAQAHEEKVSCFQDERGSSLITQVTGVFLYPVHRRLRPI